MNSKKKEFLGIITARGGSKGIPNKNIKHLAGKILLEYTFEAVNNSKLLSRCIISTDSEEIIEISKLKGMEVPFIRPLHLATSKAKSVSVLIHAVEFLKKEENYIPDYIVTLQPTSPLRTGRDIDESIEIISADENADSLVSVVEIPHNFNPNSIMTFDGKYLHHYIKEKRIMRRQDLPHFYARNGAAIYITRYNVLVRENKITGDKCLPYFMPYERSIDIDDEFDWKIAAYLINEK